MGSTSTSTPSSRESSELREQGILGGLHIEDEPSTAVFFFGGAELPLESVVASSVRLADYQLQRMRAS
jgi:hypothetical protein